MVSAACCGPWLYSWASYQIHKIAGCACAGNAGNVFPAAEFNGNRELAIPACITARASRACRDAWDCFATVAGKTFPAFPAHAHPHFYVFGKRPIGAGQPLQHTEVRNSNLAWVGPKLMGSKMAYRQVSNIRCPESHNLKVPHHSLQLSLRNVLKPCVKPRMKM